MVWVTMWVLETKSGGPEAQHVLLTTESIFQSQERLLVLKRTKIQSLCKLGGLSSNPWHQCRNPGVVMCACEPRML